MIFPPYLLISEMLLVTPTEPLFLIPCSAAPVHDLLGFLHSGMSVELLVPGGS